MTRGQCTQTSVDYNSQSYPALSPVQGHTNWSQDENTDTPVLKRTFLNSFWCNATVSSCRTLSWMRNRDPGALERLLTIFVLSSHVKTYFLQWVTSSVYLFTSCQTWCGLPVELSKLWPHYVNRSMQNIPHKQVKSLFCLFLMGKCEKLRECVNEPSSIR
jgi:hypothetical protein